MQYWSEQPSTFLKSNYPGNPSSKERQNDKKKICFSHDKMTSILYFIYSMCHSVKYFLLTKGKNVIECYSVRGWRILRKSPCLLLLISYCEFDNREDGSSISRSLQANYIDKILTLLQFNRNAFLDFSDYFETETSWFSAITSS